MIRLLPILFISLFFAADASGQSSRTPSQEPAKVVKLYPNPATTNVNFEFTRNFQRGMTIVIFNFIGKKMFETQPVSERTSVALADYNRGTYIYHVTDAGGKVIETGKFQVSR